MSALQEFDNDFAQYVLSGVSESQSEEPRAFFNEEGDCIEFLISNERFHAVRLDSLITVYYGYESGKPVGSLIKGVKKFIDKIIKKHPALEILYEDGDISLSHIFCYGVMDEKDLSDSNKTRLMEYKRLNQAAVRGNVSVKLTPAGA